MREDIQAFGKHWYDDLNLGGRAFFGGENKSAFLSIENLKDSDRGYYRCRVDFKQAPSRIYKLSLEVVGKSQTQLDKYFHTQESQKCLEEWKQAQNLCILSRQ